MSSDSPVLAPSEAAQGRVLRRIYLTLMFRRRTAGGSQRLLSPVLNFALSIFVFGLLGLIALGLRGVGLAGFAATLHGLTFIVVAVNLAGTTSTLLFNSDEAEVLLHRPIRPRALLAAKVRAIVLVSLALALALNACGCLVGGTRPGSSWLFVPAHLVSVALEVLFCTSFVVLMYNLCLRWLGRERLDNFMTAVQVAVGMGAIVAGQLVPRFVGRLDDAGLASAPAWLAALPPAWFAGLDLALMGRADSPSILLLALTAVLATGLTTWLGVSQLASAYEQGLVSLNEAGASAVRPGATRGRFVARLLRLPGLGFWLRDPVERAAFSLTLAGLSRARGVKLRVYPVLAQFLVYPVIILAGGMGQGGGAQIGPYAMAFAGAFIAMMPAMILDQLRTAEDSRAADLFWYAPLPRPASLFHGTRKAAILFLCVPAFLVALVLGVVWLPDRGELLLLLPGLIALPLFTMFSGIGRIFVPFSEPPEMQAHNAMGCLLAFVFMFSSAAIGGVAGLAWTTGWLAWLLAIEIPVVIAFTLLVRSVLDRRILRLER